MSFARTSRHQNPTFVNVCNAGKIHAHTRAMRPKSAFVRNLRCRKFDLLKVPDASDAPVRFAVSSKFVSLNAFSPKSGRVPFSLAFLKLCLHGN